MTRKNIVFLLIFMLSLNMIIPSQGALNVVWSNPLGEIWVDIFTEELDRDFDSNIDTAIIYQIFYKAEEDYNVLMNYTWGLEVYYFNSTDSPLFKSSDNWTLIRNTSRIVFLRAGVTGHGSSDFITVESLGVIQIMFHVIINNMHEEHLNWISENLSPFNETLRESNLEKNSTLRSIDQTMNENLFLTLPTPWRENSERKLAILIIPKVIWWLIGIVATIMIGLIVRRQ